MTMEHSKDFVKASLRLADRALEGARALFDRVEYFGAVSRAYYAVFHATRAILYTYGITTKTHSGLVSLFGEHIIKKGVMSGEYAEILAKALDMRQKSDYEVFTEFREEEVKRIFKHSYYEILFVMITKFVKSLKIMILE